MLFNNGARMAKRISNNEAETLGKTLKRVRASEKVPVCDSLFAFTEEHGYPGSCSGNLIGWLDAKMGERAVDVTHVEAFGREKDDAKTAYAFDWEDFNVPFNAEFGDVEMIEQHIYRFCLADGGCFMVERSDGEYCQTGLLYVPPVHQGGPLKSGLRALLGKERDIWGRLCK
jgi:hypothetical protein